MRKQIVSLDSAKPRQGWTPNQIRQAMASREVTALAIAQAHGLTPTGVRCTIAGTRSGLLGRLAVADSLGVAVTEIWPDARQRPKFRRAS